jgi:Zn-dependent membrane protease YugP
MNFFIGDYYYFVLVVPAFIFSIVSQMLVKSTFNKYSRVRSWRGITGAEAARQLLRHQGIFDVQVMAVEGSLTDHYCPKTKTIRLSTTVYSSDSVAALGVAAHETGHAIQHHERYFPLVLRTNLVPAANLGSSIGPVLAIAGLVFSWSFLIEVGIILFAISVAFYVITLPVEFDASVRAIKLLPVTGIIREEENTMAKKVLGAAALTYVASAAVAIASLIRLILLSRRN